MALYQGYRQAASMNVSPGNEPEPGAMAKAEAEAERNAINIHVIINKVGSLGKSYRGLAMISWM